MIVPYQTPLVGYTSSRKTQLLVCDASALTSASHHRVPRPPGKRPAVRGPGARCSQPQERGWLRPAVAVVQLWVSLAPFPTAGSQRLDPGPNNLTSETTPISVVPASAPLHTKGDMKGEGGVEAAVVVVVGALLPECLPPQALSTQPPWAACTRATVISWLSSGGDTAKQGAVYLRPVFTAHPRPSHGTPHIGPGPARPRDDRAPPCSTQSEHRRTPGNAGGLDVSEDPHRWGRGVMDPTAGGPPPRSEGGRGRDGDGTGTGRGRDGDGTGTGRGRDGDGTGTGRGRRVVEEWWKSQPSTSKPCHYTGLDVNQEG
ncbi:unnamed protein product [Boreogadus saida]